MSILVIVESPAEARKLGAGFTVRATLGHVWDLPGSKAPVSPSVPAGGRPDTDGRASPRRSPMNSHRVSVALREDLKATDTNGRAELRSRVRRHPQHRLDVQRKGESLALR
ncbi:hypothetical protein DM785_17030 (plasmid) [Deinococcus actinosclerus]|nr:hypothetical protein DM785_17030 [Deinococcus actinosclerus]